MYHLTGSCISWLNFSKINHPQSYNDYKMVWFRAFLFRPDSHSWLFNFHDICPNTFPVWFHQWWTWFGNTPAILPPKGKMGWDFGYPILPILTHIWKKPTFLGHLMLLGFSARNTNFNISFSPPSHYQLFVFTRVDGGMTLKLFYVENKM